MTLPVPFKEFIPQVYWGDDKADTLAAKADEHIQEWAGDVCNIDRLKKVDSVLPEHLNELGYMLNAGLVQTDSNREKREKIYSAIQGHKRRGSFELDAKSKIDAIAGGDSQILSAVANLADWILLGDDEYPQSFYWATMRGDNSDQFLGLDLVGTGFEFNVDGNVYIDVDNDSLTAAEVQEIVAILALDIVPAYYVIHIGYLDGGGNFVEYDLIT